MMKKVQGRSIALVLALIVALTLGGISAFASTTETLDSVDCTGWWTAHTPGIEITEDEVEITFHSVTYDSATDNWNTPCYVVYGGNEGVVNGDGYTEYYVCRSDVYGWSIYDGNFDIAAAESYPDDWNVWLAANKEGVDCTLTAYLDGSNVVTTLTNEDAISTVTYPVDTTQTVYLSLTGEQCTLTNIQVTREGEEAPTSGTCGENLTWSFEDGVLTISGTGEMDDYWEGDFAPWFYHREEITEVIIQDGVTSIGDEAFAYCDSLVSISIPEGVTSIGEYALFDCGSLVSVEIPDSVTSIGEGAFDWCYTMQEITVSPENTVYASVDGLLYNKEITELLRCPEGKTGSVIVPDGVTSIGYGAFSYCENLTDVQLPDSLRIIDELAFDSCDGLTSITIPEGVTSIGIEAFSWCESLASITFPDSLISIGEGAFELCVSLTSITIPDGVTSIGDGAFMTCYSLTEINVSPENSVYTSVEGILYNKEITELIFCPEGKTGCVTIPDSVICIDDWAFWSCENLTEITLPDGLESIGEGTFGNCAGLTSITIPEGVTSIGTEAFYWCEGLTSIILPKSLVTVSEDAFSGCEGLTDVYYAGSKEEWASIEIGDYNDYLVNATIHYNSTGSDTSGEEETTAALSIIIEGTDESYTLGSEETAVIHCSGNLSDFVSVSVDGVVVDEENYTLEEGSTVLKFTNSYLETLSVGEHEVTLNFTTGSVNTTLIVQAAESDTTEEGATEPETSKQETAEEETTGSGSGDKVTQTGDLGILGLVVAVIISASGAFVAFTMRKKKVIG